MSNSSARLGSDWHRVGAGFAVRFVNDTGRLDATWSPRVPTKREWKRIIDRYRAARQVFLTEYAARTGLAVACVEVPE